MNEDTTRIDYGDSFETDFGNVGDPRWPERLTMRLFRRDERGQRLVVDEQEYVRVARLSSEPRQ